MKFCKHTWKIFENNQKQCTKKTQIRSIQISENIFFSKTYRVVDCLGSNLFTGSLYHNTPGLQTAQATTYYVGSLYEGCKYQNFTFKILPTNSPEKKLHSLICKHFALSVDILSLEACIRGLQTAHAATYLQVPKNPRVVDCLATTYFAGYLYEDCSPKVVHNSTFW